MTGRNLILAATLCLSSLAMAGEHPRLFFGPEDVPQLRQRVAAEPYRSMVARLQEDLDRDGWGRGPVREGLADQSVIAQRAAFLYVITGEERYAQRARQITERIMASNEWANARFKGLTLYWHGSKLAMVYDWCHGSQAWDAAFAQRVSGELKRHGDVIFRSGGTEQNTSPASNWQGGRWASAALCYLASDEPLDERTLEQAHGRVRRFLTENLGTGQHARGWNIEGLGYTFYPMGNFVGPYAIAAARHNPQRDLRRDVPALGWTYWTTYAATTPAMGGVRLDFGDDNPGVTGEGTYGQAFYFAPEELRPGLKYWYDRMWGLQGNRTFDPGRAGTIWSILYYPAHLREANPMSIPLWREGFLDTGGNGFFTFRNQYRDATDHVAQLYVKLRGNKGHSGPDALSFRILGQGTAWAVGGGRYGPRIDGQHAYLRSMNTLYPHTPNQRITTNANSGRIVGTPRVFDNGGGVIVSQINQNNVGVNNHKRWFAADFSPASGAAATYIVADTSSDGRFWQLCTLPSHEVRTQGNRFLIRTPDGATMQGTVLHPANASLTTGQRIRGSNFQDMDQNKYIIAQGDGGNWLVVLTVQPPGRAHPNITHQGQAPQGTITVGQQRYLIEDQTITPQR